MPAAELGGEVRGSSQDDLDLLAGVGGENERGGEETPLEEDPGGEETPADEGGEGDGEEGAEGEEGGEGDEEAPTGDVGELGEEEEGGEEGEGEEGKGAEGQGEGEETPEGVDKRLLPLIEKKYPGVLKDFPQLRRAFFRDQQFSKIVDTPEQLEEISNKANVLDSFEQDLLKGDSSRLLETLKEADTGAQEKFILDFLPTVEKANKELVGKVVFPYLRRILNNASVDAKSSKNANLERSVSHIANYLWPQLKGELPDDPANVPSAKDSPEVKAANERATRAEQALRQNFHGSVVKTASDRFSREIDATLERDTRFSPIERRAIADQIFRGVTSLMDKDPKYNRLVDSRWAQARANGYPDSMKSQVINTFLGGARNRLQSVRARVIAAALKEKGVKVTKGKPPVAPGQGSSSRRVGGVKPGTIDYTKTSDDDILSGDEKRITLRKAK